VLPSSGSKNKMRRQTVKSNQSELSGPEDGGSTFLRNVDRFLPDSTASQEITLYIYLCMA
jgi:hypothetical protein